MEEIKKKDGRRRRRAENFTSSHCGALTRKHESREKWRKHTRRLPLYFLILLMQTHTHLLTRAHGVTHRSDTSFIFKWAARSIVLHLCNQCFIWWSPCAAIGKGATYAPQRGGGREIFPGWMTMADRWLQTKDMRWVIIAQFLIAGIQMWASFT